MSKLEELIKEFCPNGVDYKKLGDVCIVETGGEPPKNSVKGKHPTGKYIYPIFSNGVGENALWGFSDSYKINIPSVTFSSIGTIGCPTLRETAFTPIIRLKVLYPKNNTELDVKFLKYALETVEFKQQKSSVPNINANIKYLFYYCFLLADFCRENLQQGSFASVDMTKFNKFEFPMPPMEVQERIVKVLDNFDAICSDLGIGLPAEIEKRQKQYEY